MDRPRVLIVGDSITEAAQVDDGIPFADRLEATIPEFQFLNAGRSTMSTADYVALAPVGCVDLRDMDHRPSSRRRLYERMPSIPIVRTSK